MPQLKNLKHEVMAKRYAAAMLDPKRENPKQFEVYKEVFPEAQDNTARSAASRLFKREEVRTRVGEILAASGVPLSKLIEKYKQLSEAKKEVWADGAVRKLVDNGTRLECLKIGLRLYGVLNDAPQIDARAVTFNIDAAQAERLEKIVDEIAALSGPPPTSAPVETQSQSPDLPPGPGPG